MQGKRPIAVLSLWPMCTFPNTNIASPVSFSLPNLVFVLYTVVLENTAVSAQATMLCQKSNQIYQSTIFPLVISPIQYQYIFKKIHGTSTAAEESIEHSFFATVRPTGLGIRAGGRGNHQRLPGSSLGVHAEAQTQSHAHARQRRHHFESNHRALIKLFERIQK